METRTFPFGEIRVGEGDSPKLTGLASVFKVITVIGGMFREVVMPGAFTKTLDENDIVVLWNHNTDKPMGRTSEKTLLLREGERGLHSDNTPPETTWGRDAVISLRRRDTKGMSFGFEVIKQRIVDTDGKVIEDPRHIQNLLETRADNPEDLVLRELLEVRLHEVSYTPFPAYETTEAEARSSVIIQGLDLRSVGTLEPVKGHSEAAERARVEADARARQIQIEELAI